MTPADVRLLLTRNDLRRDWNEVRRQFEKSSSVDPARGGPEAAFVALALDHAYQAFEQILLGIERALSLPERTGDRWHRGMLADATRAMPGIRPALVTAAAEGDWEHLLGFRHFLRHAYATELDPARLARNVERLRNAVTLTDPLMVALLGQLDPDA